MQDRSQKFKESSNLQFDFEMVNCLQFNFINKMKAGKVAKLLLGVRGTVGPGMVEKKKIGNTNLIFKMQH